MSVCNSVYSSGDVRSIQAINTEHYQLQVPIVTIVVLPSNVLPKKLFFSLVALFFSLRHLETVRRSWTRRTRSVWGRVLTPGSTTPTPL